jgi:hypothetical protein
VERACSSTGGSCGTPNNWKQRAKVVARRREASKPKCRMSTKPSGSRCSRKRRKNLSWDKRVSFCLLWSAEHLAINQGDQAMVGDGHAVGVAAEILQDIFWATEGRKPGGEDLGVRE